MNNLVDFGDRLLTLSNGAKGLRTLLQVKASVPIDTTEPMIDMVASDETLDRYDEVIAADGWQLANYRKNPVIQNAHQYGDLIFTIGKAVRTDIVNGKLVQRWQFAVSENPMAKIAYGMYRGGFLNASSVGFIPIRWENGDSNAPYQRKYLEQELLEVSAVAIPANPSALALAVKAGAVSEGDIKETYKLLKHFAEKAESEANASRPGFGIDGLRLQLELIRTAMCVAA